MALYEQGITLPYQSVNAGVVQPDVFGIAINFYPNRCPLTARLRKEPTGALSFLLTNDDFRPVSSTIGAAFSDTSGTTATLADNSFVDVGDVIRVESEYMLVTAIGASNQATVVRGYAGTTAATHTNGTAYYIVTNARTGGEVDQNALNRIPAVSTQYLQTVQHAYQVSGSLASATKFVSGEGGPLPRQKMMALQHVMDDFEKAFYVGKAAGLSSTVSRQTSAGAKSLLTTSNTASPTNASAYKPSDFVRDTVQACYDNGGEPDVALVSTGFLTGLSVWGQNVQRLNVGTTSYGTPIEAFQVSFLPTLTFIPAPLFKKLVGTDGAFVFNSAEVRVRTKRRIDDYPRGRRGDAEEGDIIGEMALEIDNQAHHAWVEGISGWSA